MCVCMCVCVLGVCVCVMTPLEMPGQFNTSRELELGMQKLNASSRV